MQIIALGFFVSRTGIPVHVSHLTLRVSFHIPQSAIVSACFSLPRARYGEKLLVAVIALAAAFLRFYRLDQIPPGFPFDQAFNAFDLLRLMQGEFAIFFPANTGREPLFLYLQLVGVALFGPTSFALKLTSALVGVVTIPLIYGCARAFFQSARVAALTALFATFSFWHVFFSRDGLRVILAVPLTLLTFWLLWRAFDRRHARAFALAGFYTALALYTYPSARLLPLALILLTVYVALTDRARALLFQRAWPRACGCRNPLSATRRLFPAPSRTVHRAHRSGFHSLARCHGEKCRRDDR